MENDIHVQREKSGNQIILHQSYHMYTGCFDASFTKLKKDSLHYIIHHFDKPF